MIIGMFAADVPGFKNGPAVVRLWQALEALHIGQRIRVTDPKPQAPCLAKLVMNAVGWEPQYSEGYAFETDLVTSIVAIRNGAAQMPGERSSNYHHVSADCLLWQYAQIMYGAPEGWFARFFIADTIQPSELVLALYQTTGWDETRFRLAARSWWSRLGWRVGVITVAILAFVGILSLFLGS